MLLGINMFISVIFYFLRYIFILSYVYIYMCIYACECRYPKKPEAIGLPGAGVTGGDLWDSDPLEEQYVLLTTGAFLQFFNDFFSCLFETGSPCCPSWSGTHYREQVDLCLTKICLPLPSEGSIKGMHNHIWFSFHWF